MRDAVEVRVWLLFAGGVANASVPTVQIDWKGPSALLAVSPPEGFEISPDAPADVSLTFGDLEMTVASSGSRVTGGLGLGDVRGQEIAGHLAVQLCDKSSGVCIPSAFGVSGRIPDLKKGRLSLAVAEDAGAAHTEPVFNADAQSAADGAFAAAKESGELVILDFSAVWCPPCNLLAAEVLHAEDAEETLEGFELAVLDVDHKSSWTLKDRYAIGGYPTVVVVDAEGEEVGRVEGYPGRDGFLEFLAGVSEPAPWKDADPSTLSADDAAEGLWAKVQAGDEQLDEWIEAASESDSMAAHLARFHVKATAEDAVWLRDNAPGKALEWVGASGAWGEKDEAKPILMEALRRDLAAADGIVGADLLWYVADLSAEADQPTIYAAAAASLRGGLSGDPVRDRGHYTYLATLQDRAGDTDGAVAFLDGLTRANPKDPTFLLKAANVLLKRERFEEAAMRAERALSLSWGDNQLRVAKTYCEALVGLGEEDKASGVANKFLEQDKAPEGLDVRTTRYREQLAEFAK